jgi:hypothetical protein
MVDRDLVPSAGKRFERARLRAFWKSILTLITGRDSHLVLWERARRELALHGQSQLKLASVPLERIIGTVGRYEDFDRAFLPTHDSLLKRWRSIDRAFDEGIALPPIQLYQVGDAYFCVDGHHRISVARQRGMRYLEAQVIEVKTKVPISDHLDVKELVLRGEYLRFLERTRLDELRPDQCIEFTLPGGYDRLLEYIDRHEPKKQDQRLSEEAVCAWYDGSYLPLIQVIRAQQILEGFPARSEADLYLWLIENQTELRAQCGPDVDTERAAKLYAERHGRHLLTRAASALRDWLSEDACELVTTGQVTP